MVLELKDVTKRFGKHTAVDQLTLSIPEGEIFGFLGANGAGKTTTFRMILNLLENTEGEIFWRGSKITYDQSNEIGYLPEERGLYPKLTVKDQLVYLAKLRGMAKADSVKALKSWLERFNITEYENKKVEELSKGNQQKIQFISAVLHNPRLLILDEPFSGLDPVNVEMLKQAVIELKQAGTSIIFSSHRMEHVEELCRYLCIMKRGRPVVEGDLVEIKRSFRKKNITIAADYDVTFLKDTAGVVKYQETQQGCKLQIASSEDAKTVWKLLTEKGFVTKFEVGEPTLNDIFIEKAGESYA
ncbi:ABC transporter ATP-binding protein [Terribacillus sp. 7520-G]|uniref:ABC transporter ATP-binding protein n=1 Tax=Terribacillus TaxID=459532 RepID=UPI000BA592F1|nr:ABC transporter ATP-binding protein [Terribacillus sp. 7520-G]PAD40629.1 sodium ABC transporter ATP-binding protein [Terribacillus sp. 7520-G]